MAQWLGYMVSIKCCDGTAYQGEIKSATNQEITLTKAFCNGIPCTQNAVTVSANNIGELKLIDKQTSSEQQRSTVTVAKPIPKRAGRTTDLTLNSSLKNMSLNGSHPNKSKPIDIDVKGNHRVEGGNHSQFTPSHLTELSGSFKSGTPNRKELKPKGKWSKGWKDEECFGSPLDHKINKDFDFEKNLALFNKQAVFEEINNSQKPDVIKHLDNKKPTKYRHDENVLATGPLTYRQITVPKQDFCEYVTDDGLIIPSISRSLRKKLWEAADRVGLTWEKRAELMGRAAADISLQLLGGGHRLNPHNSHQTPTVVVLCGPHKQGSVGVNAARQLASHGVHTVIYTVSTDASLIKKEMTLYMLTKNPVAHSVSELPKFADIIIVALCEDTDNPKNYPELTDWATRNKAPVIALDPPSCGTPGITPKFSLLPVLPLPHSQRNGKLYLCNLGFPVDIFNEVGIKYKSPFGPKFVIPLHPKDD